MVDLIKELHKEIERLDVALSKRDAMVRDVVRMAKMRGLI